MWTGIHVSIPSSGYSVIAELWALIRQGALSLRNDSTFALSAFRQALAADGRRGRQGKVLLT
jgi:NADPH:quinone reductase-like Zn-dependent oxidoreductase